MNGSRAAGGRTSGSKRAAVTPPLPALRPSSPPTVHHKPAHLVYDEGCRAAGPPAKRACRAPFVRCSVRLSGNFFPQSVSAILILSTSPLFHRLTNNAASSPLQNRYALPTFLGRRACGCRDVLQRVRLGIWMVGGRAVARPYESPHQRLRQYSLSSLTCGQCKARMERCRG